MIGGGGLGREQKRSHARIDTVPRRCSTALTR
jgi:hypothetical protein